MQSPRFLLLFPLTLLLTGCLSGYRLGTTLPTDIRSVYIPMARNETDEPLLERDITQAVLDRIQRDGALSIVSEANADAILHVTVTDFSLEPLVYENTDNLRPDEYRLVLKARVEFIQTSNGKTLARTGELEGRSEFELQGDLVTNQRNAVPDASEDLARRVVAAVTEAWPD